MVTALEDVSLHVRPGEVLGLIGDNGAGKSTLVKILTGFHKPDSGKIFVLGDEVQLKSVTHARSLGIDTVFQDLALVPGMTVYHNMFLNREVTRGIGPLRFLANRVMKKRSLEYLDDIGVRVPSIDAEVARMSGGQRQAIAIARSTHSDAKILLLDEPLAAMGAREGALIIELIEELGKNSDVSMIVIAHNYVHVLEMCDRVNLLRNGRIDAGQAHGRDVGRGADRDRRRRVPAAADNAHRRLGATAGRERNRLAMRSCRQPLRRRRDAGAATAAGPTRRAILASFIS